MPDILPRWLSPEQCAAYIGERVDRLPRLLRAGKLPQPSLHLGPRSPRYDREALDQLFGGNAASASAAQIMEDGLNALAARARPRGAPHTAATGSSATPEPSGTSGGRSTSRRKLLRKVE